MTKTPQFAFGKNWKSFSASALTQERVDRARADFRDLVKSVPLRGKTFLDIGFGQGLALCLAREDGAIVCGNDIDSKCTEALIMTLRLFPQVDPDSIEVVIGSILDDSVIARLRNLPGVGAAGGFDIVHSWGALHHTGAMDDAIERAASLVRGRGHLIIAIYNRNWTSPIWSVIKRGFVVSPRLIQRVLIVLFYPLIAVTKAAVTGRNPFRKDRGMDFYHDVVDWIGGFPYECAKAEEISTKLEALNFELERLIPAAIPTGCNQFVFRRRYSVNRSD